MEPRFFASKCSTSQIPSRTIPPRDSGGSAGKLGTTGRGAGSRARGAREQACGSFILVRGARPLHLERQEMIDFAFQ
jgi:hypothetical protein